VNSFLYTVTMFYTDGQYPPRTAKNNQLRQIVSDKFGYHGQEHMQSRLSIGK